MVPTRNHPIRIPSWHILSGPHQNYQMVVSCGVGNLPAMLTDKVLIGGMGTNFNFWPYCLRFKELLTLVTVVDSSIVGP